MKDNHCKNQEIIQSKQDKNHLIKEYWNEIKLDFIETQVEKYVNKVIESNSNNSPEDK